MKHELFLLQYEQKAGANIPGNINFSYFMPRNLKPEIEQFCTGLLKLLYIRAFCKKHFSNFSLQI